MVHVILYYTVNKSYSSANKTILLIELCFNIISILFFSRDIVLASHIKPLQKGDTLENMTFEVKWNSLAGKNKANQSKDSTTEFKKVRITFMYFKTPY